MPDRTQVRIIHSRIRAFNFTLTLMSLNNLEVERLNDRRRALSLRVAELIVTMR